MSRSTGYPASWERIDTAFDIGTYLMQNFSRRVAVAIATRVEFLLAQVWEPQQEVMRKGGDPREVYEIGPSTTRELKAAFDATPPQFSDADAELHVIDRLAKFAPDGAWHASHLIRNEVVRWRFWSADGLAEEKVDAEMMPGAEEAADRAYAIHNGTAD
jgi:hypothetical protein